MQIFFLALVFLVIVLLLALHRPLYQAVLGGLLAAVLLYRIPLAGAVGCVTAVFTTASSLSVLLSLYLITFLQRILEARRQIRLAQGDLDALFHNRRINTAGAPLFIGLLPSAAAMLLCTEIVRDSTDGYLNREEQAVAASWFRHIPESCLPTYTSILLLLNLSGVPASAFLPGMVVPVLVLILLGYFKYLRRIPKEPASTPTEENPPKLKSLLLLLQHLWPLLLILVLILGFQMEVVTAVLCSILLSLLVYRVSWQEFKGMLVSAFEKKMLLNTFLVLILKEFISYTGVLQQLPALIQQLPLPSFLVFGLLVMIATIISGASGAIAMTTPIVFAASPGNVPLLIFLACVCHASSQLSPTHVCLVVAADYFQVPLGSMIRRTLPLSLLFCALMALYYLLLTALV